MDGPVTAAKMGMIVPPDDVETELRRWDAVVGLHLGLERFSIRLPSFEAGAELGLGLGTGGKEGDGDGEVNADGRSKETGGAGPLDEKELVFWGGVGVWVLAGNKAGGKGGTDGAGGAGRGGRRGAGAS